MLAMYWAPKYHAEWTVPDSIYALGNSAQVTKPVECSMLGNACRARLAEGSLRNQNTLELAANGDIASWAAASWQTNAKPHKDGQAAHLLQAWGWEWNGGRGDWKGRSAPLHP